MATFSKRELLVCQIIGGVLFGASLLMAVVGTICNRAGVGLPEFMQVLANVGLALILPSVAFLGIATAKQLITPHR
jgi:hypothetical protein